MDYCTVMICAVGMFLVIHYLLEVHAGSTTSMYDAELGLIAAESDASPRRSSHRCFLGRVVPMQLVAIGGPLLAADLRAGTMLLAVAVLLFCLYQTRSPGRA